MNPTDHSDKVDPVELHRAVVEALDAVLFEVTVEPIGWHCLRCGGRFSLSDPASTPAWRQQGLIDNLVESAGYHLRADHPVN